MAIIVGQTDSEEMLRLFDAGYKVAQPSAVMALAQALVLELGEPTVAIWVDCNISDLLTPPLCKFCGRLMETHRDPDAVGVYTGVIHICECGAWVQVCTHPPEG